MGKVSNPYNFNIKQNYIVSSELNFAYNFSMKPGRTWYDYSDQYAYGYKSSISGYGSIIANTTGLNIQIFGITEDKTLEVGYYKSSNNVWGFSNITIYLPSGKSAYYPPGNDNTMLDNQVAFYNYIKNAYNKGSTCYFYVKR